MGLQKKLAFAGFFCTFAYYECERISISQCVLAVACGPRKVQASVSQTRAFPAAEVPMMITEPEERIAWLGAHFWDRYTAMDHLYFSDSVTVNGVSMDDLEKQVGIFATLLQQGAPEGSQDLSAAIASGELKVVDIYIDKDIDAWKEHIPQYPASWINGYDPDFVIRTDLVYDVRAVPSLYLLSADKTVLLKDATTEQFFAAMGL